MLVLVIHDDRHTELKLVKVISSKEFTLVLKHNDTLPLSNLWTWTKIHSYNLGTMTVFQSEFIEGAWIIRHDITRSVFIRKKY